MNESKLDEVSVCGNSVNSSETPLSAQSESLDESDNNQQIYYVIQKLDPAQHTRIVRGDFHQGDERFAEFSRNKQCVAIAVVAACFYNIFENPSEWKTGHINQIIMYGNRQFYASHKKIKRDGKTPRTTHLLLSEVYPYFKFNRNFYYLNGLDETDFKRFECNAINMDNLISSLDRFFNQNQNLSGIFTFDNNSFAIMRKGSSYFMFNSYSTSCAGEPLDPMSKDGAAAFLQMFTIECLANHLLVACQHGRLYENDSLVFYLLVNIDVQKKVFGKDVTTRQRVSRDLFFAISEREDTSVKRKSTAFDKVPKKIFVEVSSNYKSNEIKNCEISSVLDEGKTLSQVCNFRAV